MSRKGAVWRGELAQRIEEHLQGAISADDLVIWAVDHPFFEDREELSPDEQRLLGKALGMVLQSADDEPPATRTAPEQLAELAKSLWGGEHPQV
ncbi:MAG TPA: hypothetical protein VN837_02970 [Chloroflexota bacterium]|nr:hypothetical protein [Chloroflexota bacterium]